MEAKFLLEEFGEDFIRCSPEFTIIKPRSCPLCPDKTKTKRYLMINPEYKRRVQAKSKQPPKRLNPPIISDIFPIIYACK